MEKRIFYSITGVTLFAICLLNIFIASIMYNQLFEQAKKNIKEESSHIEQVLLANGNTFTKDTFVTADRVTIIRKDGKVLFDNYKDVSKMDNHLNRPEVLALATAKKWEATRLSDTLGKQTYYYATKLDNGDIIRLSIVVASIYSILFQTTPYVILLSIIISIIAMFISKYLTRRIIAPFYNINEQTYDELELFYKKIKKQQEYIESQKNKLRQKTEEFIIITENIANGFILLNVNKEIVLINDKAIKIFGKEHIKYRFKNIVELDRSDEMQTAIKQASMGESIEMALVIKDVQYILHIAPVYSNKELAGIVILFVDNTKKAEAERIRREFSANVSHELKTPLTSISGYAELIKIGRVKDEDIQDFAGKIYSEAQNLLVLIQDIIKVSELDEKTIKEHKTQVNLKDILESNISRLEVIAGQKNIEFITNFESDNIESENIEMLGVGSVLEEAFYNILENAIKYNVVDGKIRVDLVEDASRIKISVADTGMGIPQESIARIFERFYRVDTSHSKEIHGTGLGLAIVKHAINLHLGEIHVDSSLGAGTTICVSFPKSVDV